MIIRSLTRRSAVATVVAAATLALAAAPAAAIVHPYAFDADRGLLSVGTNLNVAVPATYGNCGVDIDMVGTVDDTSSTDNLGGTLTISAPTTAPFTTGVFLLFATGVSSGANKGDLAPLSGLFTNLVFPTINFSVRNLNTTTCVPGAALCTGSASLTLTGAFTLPLATATGAVVNSSAGTVLTTSGCGFPWFAVFFPGASITIARHAAFPADPGMLFN